MGNKSYKIKKFVSRKHIFCFIIFFSILSTPASGLYSQVYEISTKSNKYFNASIYFFAGAVFGTSASDFMEEYSTHLKGLKPYFQNTPFIEGGLKIKLIDELKLCLSGGYFESRIDDGYIESTKLGNEEIERRYDQSIVVKTLPLMAAVEYFPFPNQFRTFVGFGVGAALSDANWTETIYSVITDPRKGGVHLNNKSAVPIFRLYAAIDLGFDKERYDSVLGGIVVRAGYTYLIRKFKMMEKVAEQFEEQPGRWQQDYYLISGYLSFGVSLYLNFKWELGSNLK